ncbi:MAG: methyl-accepting chemotaxis protein [Oscillospiraceae bacterium]|nr:methyl-accepting chemotaxis protein [Oscillospiraceae bacterium]
MKLSIKRRLMRLGMAFAALGSVLTAIFAALIMNHLSSEFSGSHCETVVGSVGSSLQEEMEFLANGLRDSASGDHSDIFDDVFILGEPRSYKYKGFEDQCRMTDKDDVLVTYIHEAHCYIFALNRGEDIIAGQLRDDYFDYVTDVMSGDGCYGYMVCNSTGEILISSDKAACGEDIRGDDLYAAGIDAVQQGNSSLTGNIFSEYIVYATPVPDNPRFSIFYCVESHRVYHTVKIAMVLMFGYAALIILVSFFTSVKAAGRISRSILPTVECLDKFSNGIIDTSFKANSRGDETQQLSEAMEKTINSIGTYIKDIDYILTEIAGGNLIIESSCDYRGDFGRIKNSLDTITGSLRKMIGTIRDAGEQVNSGVSSLASGAQLMAANSSSEAQTLKKLDQLVRSINDNVNANSEMIGNMRSLSESVVTNVENGSHCMKNLNVSIEEIRQASEEISQLASLIEDIAFQTNILALNAAVEAARAGDAGKGFAVVADEVRMLAGRASEAAQNAVKVTERSMGAVERGVKYGSQTMHSLDEIYTSVNDLSGFVSKVADTSIQQANDINVVNKGLNRITTAVDSNAATAEGSAANSEEIATQAQILEKQLRNFKVR